MEVPGKAFYVVGDDISDGYHTFGELYEHQIELWLALCRWVRPSLRVWRSTAHSDSTMYEGLFIMGIGTRDGNQITYHLPMSRWDDASFAETMHWAPEWDGHTPADVLERLKRL